MIRPRRHAALGWGLLQSSSKAAPQVDAKAAQIENGKRLVSITGCNHCHSPKTFTPQGPRVDASRLLFGFPVGTKLPDVPAGPIAPDKWGAVTTNDRPRGPTPGERASPST